MKHFTLVILPLCITATAFAGNWPGLAWGRHGRVIGDAVARDVEHE